MKASKLVTVKGELQTLLRACSRPCITLESELFDEKNAHPIKNR